MVRVTDALRCVQLLRQLVTQRIPGVKCVFRADARPSSRVAPCVWFLRPRSGGSVRSLCGRVLGVQGVDGALVEIVYVILEAGA